MTTTVEAVFEKGVFRPLQPVSIPENRRVRIRFDEPGVEDLTPPPRLMPREYPEADAEGPDTDPEYQPVPPKAVRTVRANVIAAGRPAPAPYPEE